MNNNDMAIAVISFDGYSDVWDVFVHCINHFWRVRKYETYLITNEYIPDYEGINIVTTGKEISWSHRVRKALDSIKSDYVLILLEDYLISDVVDSEKVDEALSYMNRNNLDYLRIAPIPIIKNCEKNEYASEITSEMLYGINLQASIWKRDFLLRTLGTTDFSAWEFEARQKFGEPTRIDGNCYATNKFIIPYLNGIIQGKWYVRTVESLASLGIDIQLGVRSVMTDKDMRSMNFRNFLQHNIPPRLIHILKPIAKKLGFKFVT